MRIQSPTPIGVLCVLTLGCTAPVSEDVKDTGTPPHTHGTAPLPIWHNIETPGCEDTTNWIYRTGTNWESEGTAIINAWVSTDDLEWNEEHTLETVDFDPNEAWELGRTPQAGVDKSDHQPDLNTVFQCGIHDIQPVATYVIRFRDLDGNYSDCYLFGTDPNGEDEVFNGTAPSPNPVADRDQITRENCYDSTNDYI